MPRANRERFVSSALHVSREGGVLSQCPSPGVQTRTGSCLDQAISQPSYWPTEQLPAAVGQACALLVGQYLVNPSFTIQLGHHHTTFTVWHSWQQAMDISANSGRKRLSWKDHKRLVCTDLKFIKHLLKAMVFAHCWREGKQIIFPLE